jgi:hypothetical protein
VSKLLVLLGIPYRLAFDAFAANRVGFERETGFEPATFSLEG